MSPENSEKLVETYPNLYRDGICFECDDGWFDLINKLSDKLEKYINENYSYNEDDCVPSASQVKEKFGTLRFYVTFGTDYIYDQIDQAEEESAKTCEVCGEAGKLNKGSWIQTLCQAHWK